jgi:PAS domain-containing protein
MGTPLRVLIIEDSEDDTLLIMHELKRGGYDPKYERVETAGAMNDALDRQGWDIVISDHSMPHFNSFSALDVLKKRGLDLPFFLVSGTIGEEMAVLAMKTGVHDYIMKGNLSRLVSAVERELREAVVRREHKKAEEALRSSEEKYRTILEAIEEGYFEVDIAGNFTFFNDSLCRMLGYTRDELMGMSNRQYMDKETAKKVYQVFNRLYTTEGLYEAFYWEIIRNYCLREFIPAQINR